jgi:hypothetical protein
MLRAECSGAFLVLKRDKVEAIRNQAADRDGSDTDDSDSFVFVFMTYC